MPQTANSVVPDAPPAGSAPASPATPSTVSLAPPQSQRGVADLVRLAEDFTSQVLSQPTRPGMTVSAPTTTQPHSLSAVELLESLERSERTFSGLLAYIKQLTTFGTPTTERSVLVGAELMPVALLNVSDRTEKKQSCGEGELRLFRTYLSSHNNGIELPEWFSTVRPLLQLSGAMSDLPSPVIYLAKTKLKAQEAAPLIREHTKATNEYLESSSRLGSHHDSTVAKGAALEAVTNTLDKFLSQTTDIKPETMEECCNRVEVRAQPSLAVTVALNTLHDTLGALIAASLLGGESPGSSAVDVPEFVSGQSGAKIQRFKADVASVTEELKLPVNKARLLTAFCGVREQLVACNKALVASKSTPSDTKSSQNALERTLGKIFSSQSGVDGRILSTLLEEKEPALQPTLARLFSQQQRVMQGSGPTTSYDSVPLFALKECAPILRRLVADRLSASEQHSTFYRQLFENSSLSRVAAFIDTVRARIARKDFRDLALKLDQEISSVASANDTTSFQRKAVLLFSLAALTRDPTIKEVLKGNLTKIDLVKDICTSFGDELSRSSQTLRSFSDGLRRDIERAFSFDLSDYWGNRALVEEWKSELEENISLLKNPNAWAGSPAELVFLNGFLLHGPPGAGKTYLVRCMANELGLPLVLASKEDMTKQMRRAARSGSSVQATSGLEESKSTDAEAEFASYLDAKIAEAKESMRKSGTVACMLFIDELEAEFANRNNLRASPQDMARVNSMLTIIERQMKAHPEIFFVGATNHIDLVEPAALRPGRFGIHKEIKLPTQEEIVDFLGRALRVQGVTLDTGDAGLEELAAQANGMTPLALHQSVARFCSLTRIDVAANSDLKVVSVGALKHSIERHKQRQRERSDS